MIELTDNLTKSVIKLAEEAGRAILQIYAGPINVTVKGDSSPLTQADQLAHSILTAGLSTLTPQLPVISEESSAEEQARRPELACYWLIDPLDGTKEFIQRNGEFTVNIALIEQGVSRFGVVHVPVWGTPTGGGPVSVPGARMVPVSKRSRWQNPRPVSRLPWWGAAPI